MTISNIYRNRTLNEISEGDVGAELKVAGWIENIRDHGGVSFIDLRDMYGDEPLLCPLPLVDRE